MNRRRGSETKSKTRRFGHRGRSRQWSVTNREMPRSVLRDTILHRSETIHLRYGTIHLQGTIPPYVTIRHRARIRRRRRVIRRRRRPSRIIRPRRSIGKKIIGEEERRRGEGETGRQGERETR